MKPSAIPPARHPGRGRPAQRREAGFAAAAGALVLAACLLPASLGEAWRIPPHFVDARAWGSLPNALDVLSNLPFLLLGVAGLRRLRRLEAAHDAGPRHVWAARPDELPLVNALDCAWLFFSGLILVAGASAFYHLLPADSLRLAGDRATMAVAFAGLLGLAAGDRISPRAAWPAAWAMLAGALAAVAVSQASGNLVPWAVVQFGGMALMLAMALLRPVGATGMRLGLGGVIALYALAKLCEMGDAPIYEATGHLVSGHTLKHLVAALAALPVLGALRRLEPLAAGHNRTGQAVTA